jgi:HK97 family phage major capsid protein
MNITELNAKLIDIRQKARDLIEKNDMTGDDAETVKRMLTEADGYELRVSQLEEIERKSKALEQIDRLPVENSTVEARSEGDTREKAFADYLRGNIDGREFRAAGPQGVSADADGGFLVPEGYIPTLVKALKAYGPLYLDGPVHYLPTSSGNPLPIPTLDDTSSVGALIGENTEAEGAEKKVFGQKTFTAKKYTSGVVKVSRELFQDSVFDIAALVGELSGEALGRIINTHLTTGNGTTQPGGIVTGASAGITAAATNAITADDFVKLEASVDPAYRVPGCGYMFNDATRLSARLLKDADGRPMWQTAMVAGQPDLINGRPFWVNQDMANIGAGAVPIIFGNFSKFWVRKVNGLGIQRLNERYAEFDQVGFVTFVRVDSAVVDARAIKKLTMAAS